MIRFIRCLIGWHYWQYKSGGYMNRIERGCHCCLKHQYEIWDNECNETVWKDY